MRHRKAGLKINRTSSHRKAMFRNMVTSLFKYESIRTTDAKAKELRRWADHLITLAKRGDLHARRQALSIIREKQVVHKLFDEAQKRFGSSAGGYTRVIKIGRRQGDAAFVSQIELISHSVGDTNQNKKKDEPIVKVANKTSDSEKQETDSQKEVMAIDNEKDGGSEKSDAIATKSESTDEVPSNEIGNEAETKDESGGKHKPNDASVTGKEAE